MAYYSIGLYRIEFLVLETGEIMEAEMTDNGEWISLPCLKK